MKAKTAIKKLETMYPKTCKMVNGRLQGGFDDTTCEGGEAINIAIKVRKTDPSDNKFCAYCGQALKFQTETC